MGLHKSNAVIVRYEHFCILLIR
uniref:Uncharacterized protein n=1 Tax=Anguilla anguilla TaxID=7936 RepID=A0A0E9S4A7_ANGAN